LQVQPTLTELQQVRARAELLHGPRAVQQALDRMATEITAAIGASYPVALCVLTGGIIPAGQLLTRLAFPLEVDYLHATRYRGATVGEQVQWVSEPGISLAGRTVLVIDDILDEGHTLADIQAFCRSAGAARIYSAVLVQKCHDRCSPEVSAECVGLEVSDRYVFGFGMDYKGQFRNLDAIYALAAGDS
jgi:hypoxanthine phosphoribosyltransferase